MTIYTILKTIRERTPLLIKDICALLGMKHWGTLSRIESGKQIPSLEVILTYHLLFNIPLETILSQDLKRLNEQIRQRIGDYTKKLLPDVKQPDVYERMNHLTTIYEKLKN